MKAVCVDETVASRPLVEIDTPVPTPAPGELLIRVKAAGITPTELVWYPTIHTQAGEPRHFAVPGHEFSGEVEALGVGAGGHFNIGQEIYGMSDWFIDGATAEYCLTVPSSIAPKPASLSHAAAASVPIGALAAHQGLFERGNLQPGERVLIHGGAGAVGVFAIQLAHRAGAHVITTASARHRDFLLELGADEVLDYRGKPFEEIVHEIDLVFDGVGGETLARSWGVLKPDGRLVTIAAEGEGTQDERTKAAFFIVEPNQAQLVEVAALLDSGELKTFVDAAVPLDRAMEAYAGQVERPSGIGKVVVTVN